LFLDGLSRHLRDILGATALYDFATQLAAYDSPITSFLSDELREQKNYPMVCQSLQQVAAYLGFDWGEAYRNEIFRERLFDFWGKFDEGELSRDERPWYSSRARFNSQIPLEYAYVAWGAVGAGGFPRAGTGESSDDPRALSSARPAPSSDSFAPYRKATVAHLQSLAARRLEAIEWIARRFPGNKQTVKSSFVLPDLAEFRDKARTLAHALDEFVTIERHVDLAAWKSVRNFSPERRVLMGESLILRYLESDQSNETVARLCDAEQRQRLREQFECEYLATHSAPGKPKLSKEQKKTTEWSYEGLIVRLRVDITKVDCLLEEVLALSTLREGDMVVLAPRVTADERLPVEQRVPFTPTPKQLLYMPRATIKEIQVERDEDERPIAAHLDLEMRGEFYGGKWAKGFVFGAYKTLLQDDALYTIDASPDDWYGLYASNVTEGLCAAEDRGLSGVNTIYDRLKDPGAAVVQWPQEALEGQRRFYAGLVAFHDVGLLHDFEPSQRAYIESYGDEPLLMVQGPPGTGKSYSTAFALFARLQGAMAAALPFRVVVSCKTHAATDVLLDSIVKAQRELSRLRQENPSLFARHFDSRLLAVPLYRFAGRHVPPAGVTTLQSDRSRTKGTLKAYDTFTALEWGILAATPGGIYRLAKDQAG
ncbi:MAG: AAA domain-containing protein, partial [Ardenticatenaceae bacterium]